jgi:alcohol dehydrogenase class IV
LAKAVEVPDFILAIKELNNLLGIPNSFKEMGIDQETFDKYFDILVDNSLKGSTRVNPIPVSKDEMEKVLRSIYQGKNIGN